MEEIMAEVEALKTELNEVNLLNAKLLYVNKIFRSKNLTESQKSKVLAAFDKAGSVNEAKLVFETISENLTTTKKEIVKENLSRASKAAGVAPKQPIMEVDSQVSRWQKLAGIK
jgi:prolyl oligopeptidase PreP (S9A serine peptidase family)